MKVGSAVLARGGALDTLAVERLARDVSEALAADTDRRVVIVSSGAVASGYRALGHARPPREIVGKQAAAAVGQPRLMGAWAEAFRGAGGRAVGQVLLTAEDIDHRERFLNARRTLEALLDAGVVPIVNENDSVSYAEIKLGDNDHLSSLVASLVGADLLVILSSVAGVWAGPPARGKSPEIVPQVRSLAEGLRLVQAGRSDVGTGGMATKVRAACTAAGLGTHVVIADGSEPGVVTRLCAGEPLGTHFPAGPRARAARKRWIGFGARPRGTLRVDEGARRALTARGASLLPSGLTGVEGNFGVGALVELAGPDGATFARGLTLYGADDLRRIQGRRSADAARTLGDAFAAEEVVHRDDLALLDDAPAATAHAGRHPSTRAHPRS